MEHGGETVNAELILIHNGWYSKGLGNITPGSFYWNGNRVVQADDNMVGLVMELLPSQYWKPIDINSIGKLCKVHSRCGILTQITKSSVRFGDTVIALQFTQTGPVEECLLEKGTYLVEKLPTICEGLSCSRPCENCQGR